MSHNMPESKSTSLISAFFKFSRTRWHNVPADGLSLVETNILEHIQRSKRRGRVLRVSDLSAAMRVSSPTITQQLNGLEGQGFVERTHSKEDKRTVNLSLTEKGEDALKTHWLRLEEDFDEFITLIGEESADKMIDLLMQAHSFFNHNNDRS